MMFDLAGDHQSLSDLTDFELVLSHCFEKIGAVNPNVSLLEGLASYHLNAHAFQWRHSEVVKAALQYGRESGYFNSQNLLTSFGQDFARIKSFDLPEAA